MSEPHQKIAVHGLIKNGDKYLLTKRSKFEDFKPGEWDIPGGSIEFGEEDSISALNREILEETGLITKIGNIIYLFSQKQSEIRHQFQFVYECEYLGGEIILDLNEHDEYRWVTVSQMGELKLIQFVRSLYENILTK